MCGDCKHEHGAGSSCGSCGDGAVGGSAEKMCGGCGTSMGKGHAARCCKWLCTKLLWLAGVVVLVGALVADKRGALVWGATSDHLLHYALAALVLSVSLRLMKRKCGGGGCSK